MCETIMCALSVIMDNALGWPQTRWQDPQWVGHFEELCKEAKLYDIKTGQKDCENDGKKQAILDLATELGITVNFPE